MTVTKHFFTDFSGLTFFFNLSVVFNQIEKVSMEWLLVLS